jgi:hypothetical protein
VVARQRETGIDLVDDGEYGHSMGLVWYYAETNPVMSRLGRVTLDRIQSDSSRYPRRSP